MLALGGQNALKGSPNLTTIEYPPTTPDPVNETETTTSPPRFRNKKVLRMSGGSIQSENYPDNYPNYVDKTYTVTTSPGDLIQIEFSHFALEVGRRISLKD